MTNKNESYVMYFPVSQYTAGLKLAGKKMARVPSMYFTVSAVIPAAEYTAGLLMLETTTRVPSIC